MTPAIIFTIIGIFVLHQCIHCQADLFECNESEPCSNQNILCADTEDCTIECSGHTACLFSTIICPASNSNLCSISCTDDLSCSDITVKAQASKSLIINSNGFESLSSATIYCPEYYDQSTASCQITYSDSQFGLSSSRIYTVHDSTSIDIDCVTSSCWSDYNSPTLHFGDALYSKMCSFYGPNDCRLAEASVNDIDHTTTTSFTATDVNSVILFNSDAANNMTVCTLPQALPFVMIGIVIGLGLASLCFVAYFPVKTLIKKKQLQNVSHANKRTPSPNKWTPSLRKLSPKLSPVDVDVDFMQPMPDVMSPGMNTAEPRSSVLPEIEGDDGIKVTIQEYANAENKCDESVATPVSSTMRPGARLSAVFDPYPGAHHAKNNSSMLSMIIDIDTPQPTDGIAPDEFVIGSEDE